MDFISLLRLLAPLLSAIVANLPPTTPAYVTFLANLALKIIGQYAANAGIVLDGHAHLLGASAPVDIPPEDEWTVEGLTAHAKAVTGDE